MLQNPIVREMAAKTRNPAPVSPLRYPGAKRWMSSYVARSITQNSLYPELFVEPFAGGASVSLAMLYLNLVKRVALVDKDPLVAAFWHAVFFDTEWLIRRIKNTDVTLENWYQLKYQNPKTPRGKAFKCFYLNRTSFSGILAPRAGPIGGHAQTSEYKIDCRFNKDLVIKRITRIAQYRDRVAFVWNLSWKAAISRIQSMQTKASLPKSVLFYLDPPFYAKADTLYTHYFKHKDHVSLCNYLSEFNQPWILSYDSHPEIIAMYKDGGHRAHDVNLIYTASKNGKRDIGKEMIVSNLENMVSELRLGENTRATNLASLRTKYREHRKENGELAISQNGKRRRRVI